MPTRVDGGGTCSVGLTRLDDVRRRVVGEGRGDAKRLAPVRRGRPLGIIRLVSL